MAAGRRVGPGCSRHHALESLEQRRLLSASGFVLGPGDIHPLATAMDATGNIIVMGKFREEIDFNPRRNRTYILDGGYDYDNQTYFIAKYSHSGDLAWVVRLEKTGGYNDFEPQAVATDGGGSIYVAGTLDGSFDANPSPLRVMRVSTSEAQEAVVWKLTPEGGLARVSTLTVPGALELGVGGFGGVYNLAVDGAGNSFITLIADRDVINSDPYIAKFNSKGAVTWLQKMPEDPNGILALDRHGAPAMFTDPDENWVNLVRFDSKGNVVSDRRLAGVYHPYNSEFNPPPIASLAFDKDNNALVCGTFDGATDFDAGPGQLVVRPRQRHNRVVSGSMIYLAKYNVRGRPIFVKAIGGEGDEVAGGASIDSKGFIHLAGSFNGTVDLDPSAKGSFILDGVKPGIDYNTGVGELFQSRYDSQGRFVSADVLPAHRSGAYPFAFAWNSGSAPVSAVIMAVSSHEYGADGIALFVE